MWLRSYTDEVGRIAYGLEASVLGWEGYHTIEISKGLSFTRANGSSGGSSTLRSGCWPASGWRGAWLRYGRCGGGCLWNLC